MLLTLLTLCGIVAAAGLAGLLLVVVPYVRTVDVAERRGFSSARAGALAVAGIVLMLGLGYWVISGGHSKVLLLPAIALAWVGLAVAALIDSDQHRVGGSQGLHER